MKKIFINDNGCRSMVTMSNEYKEEAVDACMYLIPIVLRYEPRLDEAIKKNFPNIWEKYNG